MSDTTRLRHQFGTGPLSRAAAMVYTLMVVEGLLLVAVAPGLVGLLLLDRDASNLPLAAVCALPVGPAVTAAVYAMQHRRADLTDLRPAAAFLRGYRSTALGVLALWVPLLVWLTIIGVNLTHLAAAGVPRWWAVLLVVIGVVAALWGGNMLVISALFTFRRRDVARLAAYFLVRTKGVTLGNACLMVVAVAITALTSELVLAMLGSVLVAALLLNCRPLVDQVRRDFTA